MSLENTPEAFRGWIFIFISEKGGVRKTATLSAFVSHMYEMVPAFPIFEIDDQPRLKRWFGDKVQTLRLPDLATVRHDDLADQMVLTPLIDSILDQDAENIAIDVAGSVDGRVLEAFVLMDFMGAARDAGYRIAAFVPYNSESDAIALASRTIDRVSVALPGTQIVPVHSVDGGSLEHLPAVTARHLASMQKERTTIVHPRLLPRALAAVEATRRSPYDLAAMPDKEALRMLAETGIPRALARGVHSGLVCWQAEILDEFDRLPFGVRDEAEA
ncbi:hypothetical protein [Aurantimonas sp. NFXS3]|uniref:hypothetical protein n=1 Tax=Aurantimonas sp. NFXS3 TaxID=2818434 RepID=UPI003B8C0324